MLNNKIIFFVFLFSDDEIAIAQSLEVLRKRGFSQDLITKTIVPDSSLENRNIYSRFFSSTKVIDYEYMEWLLGRFKRVQKEITQKKKLSVELLSGYVSLYHTVILDKRPSLFSLYFYDGMYQKIELFRDGFSWSHQKECHKIFTDKRAITFCDDLYRILKGENI